MQKIIDNKQLRSFGFLVGGVFALLGLGPMLFGKAMRLWAVIPSGLLFFLAMLAPASLGLVYRVWMKIGHVLGWINTRIILSVAYYGLFVPMGFIMRLAGRDPMRRRYEPDSDTYRVPSAQRPSSHMLRQF
jgi:Saxitoxin biosynthesis operon protein SxtJ